MQGQRIPGAPVNTQQEEKTDEITEAVKKAIPEQLKAAIKANPERAMAVLLLILLRWTGDVASVIMLGEGIKGLEVNDANKAFDNFVAAAVIAYTSKMFPIQQASLLVTVGTKFATHLTNLASDAFFRTPEYVAYRMAGDTHEFVHQFGGASQPGGVAHGLFPTMADIFSSLGEVVLLNGVMWYKFGTAAFPMTVMSVVNIAALPPTGYFVKTNVIKFIDDLYQGFSISIDFANGYLPNIHFNQQNTAIARHQSFLINQLNPSTELSLQTGLNAYRVPVVLGLAGLLGELAYVIYDETLATNDLIMLLVYSMMITSLFDNLARRIVDGLPSFGLFLKILDYITKASPERTVMFDAKAENTIKMTDIAYAYPRAISRLFEKVNFDIPAGKIFAMTGDNGTGKSTLLKMFEGFTDPIEGMVQMGGQDITQVNAGSMRTTCALILQKPNIILGNTFKTNINCRNQDATDEEIRDVMKAVGLLREDKSDEADADQPDEAKGHQPDDAIPFGHSGPEISGGECQKVEIARALLGIRKGSIRYLFYDEGTSNLDRQSEEKILALLSTELRAHGVTAIMVTHHKEMMNNAMQFDGEINMNEFSLRKKPFSQTALLHRRNSSSAFHQPPRIVADASNDNAALVNSAKVVELMTPRSVQG